MSSEGRGAFIGRARPRAGGPHEGRPACGRILDEAMVGPEGGPAGLVRLPLPQGDDGDVRLIVHGSEEQGPPVRVEFDAPGPQPGLG